MSLILLLISILLTNSQPCTSNKSLYARRRVRPCTRDNYQTWVVTVWVRVKRLMSTSVSLFSYSSIDNAIRQLADRLPQNAKRPLKFRQRLIIGPLNRCTDRYVPIVRPIDRALCCQQTVFITHFTTRWRSVERKPWADPGSFGQVVCGTEILKCGPGAKPWYGIFGTMPL